MLQAYQGYFGEDMRFYADDVKAEIPINKRVIINILDDDSGRKHIPLKERLKNFHGEYEFEEWDFTL